jgi:catechol 2,3-dioxygenase-like lactoylglutathione lyase family enzyme
MRRSHRPSLAALLLTTGALLLLAGSPRATTSSDTGTAAVTAVRITVDDLDRALAFYTGVLPFERLSVNVLDDDAEVRLTGISGRRRVAHLGLGDERLDLVDYLGAGGRPLPADSRSQDRWFQHVAIIVSDMDRAFARLESAGVEHVSPSPQRLPDWNPNAGGIRAFYFRDPDRHVLEVLEFPAGKGQDRWHRRDGPLFLGIDHTAIVVGDSPASLAFYRDRIGLRVAGTSDNFGPEQERLNNVAGARLHITALRGPTGPGVEFLEYRAPADGRPFPGDARADDLAHWETVVRVGGLSALADRLQHAGILFVSPAVIRLDAGRAALVRDPDGHAVRLLESQS